MILSLVGTIIRMITLNMESLNSHITLFGRNCIPGKCIVTILANSSHEVTTTETP